MKTTISTFVMTVAGVAFAATAFAQAGGGPNTTSPAMPGPTQPAPSGVNKPAGVDRDGSSSSTAAPGDATRSDRTGATGAMKSGRSTDGMK